MNNITNELIPESGFILSFNLNRNNIQDKKYTGVKQKADPFIVYFPNDKEKKHWDLELDPLKYNQKILDGWFFNNVPYFMESNQPLLQDI